MLTVPSYYRTHTLIEQQRIEIQVARMTVGQASAFRRAYDTFSSAESVRLVSTRQPGEEMEQRLVPRALTSAEIAAAEALAAVEDTGEPLAPLPAEVRAAITACRALVPPEPTKEVFVIPDTEIRRRRLAEMTPEAREAFDALDAREDALGDAFLTDTITRYVTVPPGQIEERDPDTGEVRAVTTGADLVRIFAGQSAVLLDLVNVIRIENALPESAKKAWRSLFASSASSSAPATDPVGNAPAPTAIAAAPKGSANPEAAMVGSVTGPAVN